MKDDILPLTQTAVKQGNKIFGAAILTKKDLNLVIAATNLETKNPLYHGEISCLNQYWELTARPNPKDCIFLSTHEPCSLCLSAITWSGFDNFYYFFNYQDSKDKFNIPHDLKILDEVFNCHNGHYQKNNAYWKSYHLLNLIAQFDDKQKWQPTVDEIKRQYHNLSENYQSQKEQQNIPLN